MEPLDRELQSLVAAERREVEPTLAERERVARSLARRLGMGFGTALGLMSTKAGAAAASSSVAFALKVSLTLLLAGTAALVVVPRLTHRAPPLAPASRAVPPPASSHRAPPAQTEALPALPPSEPSAKTDDTPSPAKGVAVAHTLPPLAEEARLLKQAQHALRAGKPQVALTALAEHQRRFPRGQLALERNAARVTALCTLGRTPQAVSEARIFLQQHPQSGLSQQVRASCGLASEDRK